MKEPIKILVASDSGISIRSAEDVNDAIAAWHGEQLCLSQDR